MHRTIRAAVSAAALLLLAAACGDDDSGDNATPAASGDAAGGGTTAAGSTDDPVAAGIARAQAFLDAHSEPPTEIGPTIPLDGVPEHKTVAWLECALPACTEITPGFEAATEALGWDLEVISVDSFNPGPGFQQAIDAGVDYIALTGTPVAVVQTQIEAAKAAGIGFFQCYSTDDPDPDANILMQCGDDESVANAAKLLADWTIVDSSGAAHVLMVNIPDFPILAAEAEGAAAEYEANCPNCTFDTLDVTIEQLTSGEVPGAVASALQANPSINYLHFSFGDIPAGVADTLEASGLLEQVKLTGVDFNIPIGLTEIVAGRHHAWTANPKVYAAWLMVDAMARDALGMENTEERSVNTVPIFVVDDAETARSLIDTNGWAGPARMEAQFLSLWGIR